MLLQLRRRGYQEIKTPQVVERTLWERSGHWDKFRDDMFTTNSEDRDYAIKPMNCPCHIQVFNQGLRSYRELPLRLAEFGSCHRTKPPGALHGPMRGAASAQDDAHIFVQTTRSVKKSPDLSTSCTTFMQISALRMSFTNSRHGQSSGSVQTKTGIAQKALADALDAKALPWSYSRGGAFYGPKIEFS
ncbi:MAG: hypothetical protein IPM37_03760 [Hahellaceae bacterium]|nr:hypothetical protein [Hahellaceae bacterium]